MLSRAAVKILVRAALRTAGIAPTPPGCHLNFHETRHNLVLATLTDQTDQHAAVKAAITA